MTERSLANGRYVLSEQPIGVGGMGTVWKALDTVLRREVAVKELRIPEGLSPADRDRLRARAMREAQAAAGLDHPGIVTIYDVVDEGGRPWIVMRLLSGRSLDQVVRADGPLSPRRTAELGLRLLDALTTAHAGGVLHRDVKPQNVMLGADGRWMLTDFGIASVAGATRTLTGTGTVSGTLGYIAPERLSGAEAGAAADLWALGATLYFAVEGRPAHDHDDVPAMIAAILTRDPAPPHHAGSLAPVIAGLLERDPGRRLDAGPVREQLLAVADGYPTFERPAPRPGVANRSTEEFGGPTQVLPDGGTRIDQGDHRPEPSTEGITFVRGNRVLRALGWQLAALNGVLGALAVLLVYGGADGRTKYLPEVLPVAAIVLVMTGAVGGLGALLAPRLMAWFGLRTVLVGNALLAGGSLVTGAFVADLGLDVPGIVLAVVALVAFGSWYRSSGALRKRIVPATLLSQVSVVYRELGAVTILLGVAAAVGYLWLVDPQVRPQWGGDYFIAPFIGCGSLVIAAALLVLFAVRAAGSTGTNKPAKR
ncbi:bifunctional serine/threonine protein kinase/MFS transporter [Kribbella sp. NPDC051587]|uniref:bifunctional serine/threonine protein kinase/MFS transporter n=1 Tax=Kribbella sp. NPDC051587 TaxID=3364119 RepID=UPI00379C5264